MDVATTKEEGCRVVVLVAVEVDVVDTLVIVVSREGPGLVTGLLVVIVVLVTETGPSDDTRIAWVGTTSTSSGTSGWIGKQKSGS